MTNIQYYSQYEQDKWLIDNIFKGERNGYKKIDANFHLDYVFY